ncbi:MAG: RNA methyltransferase [Anaerolineales bacterium]|nr:RNA methyltransferase [Anaerolineales bacterium]MDW8161648.1 RNA methyltransferase [Anaerolineales bacterium]
MITSLHNPKVRWIKALQSQPRRRNEEGVFVVEGVRLAEEVLRSGWPVELGLFVPSPDERRRRLVAELCQRGVNLEEVSLSVLRAISETETPQGILLVVKQQSLPLPEKPSFTLLVDSVRDPGNLGSILRTAAAAAVEAVILPPATVDVYSPKVVRAGMGAHFRLPILRLSWEEIERLIQRHCLTVFLAEAQGEVAYDQADFRQPFLLIIGGEAEGASPKARALAHRRVFIPMPGGTESLNAAVSAGILIFEAIRQRTRPSIA